MKFINDINDHRDACNTALPNEWCPKPTALTAAQEALVKQAEGEFKALEEAREAERLACDALRLATQKRNEAVKALKIAMLPQGWREAVEAGGAEAERRFDDLRSKYRYIEPQRERLAEALKELEHEDAPNRLGVTQATIKRRLRVKREEMARLNLRIREIDEEWESLKGLDWRAELKRVEEKKAREAREAHERQIAYHEARLAELEG